MPSAVKSVLIDISVDDDLSSVLDLGDNRLFALHLPAAFTSTAITFVVAPTADGTYQALMDDAGNAISLTVAQGETIGITGSNAAALAACRFVKLVTGSGEAGDRTIKVLMRN